MTEFSIKQALNYQLDQFLLTYPIDIKDEGIPYEPVKGTPFLEVTFIPGDKFQRSFGEPSYNRVNGIYQIDINVEAGKGEGKIMEIARALEPFFKRGIKITTTDDQGEEVKVTITRFYTSKKVFLNSPDWYSKIYNIRWRSDIPN